MSNTESHWLTRNPDPTPEQIAAACAAIQAGWSESDRRHRRDYDAGRARVVHPEPLAVPIVREIDLSVFGEVWLR